MPTAVQFPSTDTAGVGPSAATPFSLWFNAAEQHLYCYGSNGSIPRSLNPVRWWDPQSTFGIGDLVVVDGGSGKSLYRCTTAQPTPEAELPRG